MAKKQEQEEVADVSTETVEVADVSTETVEVAEQETTKKDSRYQVTTPNPNYNGYVFGIPFTDGQAIFDNQILAKSKRATLKDADEVAKLLESEFHYQVTPL